MRAQILVMAKAPVPGAVKTRLCPPCTPAQAAELAAASLADTLDTITGTPAERRILALAGRWPSPAGWHVLDQRGVGLGERLAHACTDTALTGVATLVVGADTPQLTAALLTAAAGALDRADAVLGPADDGGFWLLGLREPSHAAVLRTVPMSTRDTGERTLAALHRRGLSVRQVARLRDVDTAADAVVVAAQRPRGRFAAAVRAHLPPTPSTGQMVRTS